METKPSVLVLGGGPDAEREVSLVSSKSVAKALTDAGHEVNYQVIDRPGADELSRWGGEVVFPVLHGGWGEGGPLQDVLDRLARPYVGCRGKAARLAMDKIATKMLAAQRGVPTAASAVFNPRDEGCPLGEMPVVMKPIHEGSSVGVHICRTGPQWTDAVAAVREDQRRHPERAYMVERAIIGGRELTVGVIGSKTPGQIEVLDPVEIRPAVEFYDYQAKYKRNDTRYTVDPELPAGVKDKVQAWARTMFEAIGCRHLSRIDFLLGGDGVGSGVWLLEVNTMPGFTDHSLLPMAAAHRGMPMPAICSHLVSLAWVERR